MESFLGYYIIGCIGMAALMPLVVIVYIKRTSAKIDRKLQEVLSREIYKATNNLH